MHPALRAKPILDSVFAKCVGVHIFLWRKQPKLLPWNKPKERPFAGTDGAIAIDDLCEFAFDFKSDLSAMTATFVIHFAAPLTFNIFDVVAMYRV